MPSKLHHFSIFLLTWLFVSVCITPSHTMAQARVTDTPVRVIIPTSTPVATEITLSTPTRTPTPTEEQGVLLEAAANPSEINVRDAPDTTGNYLGSLEEGQTYRVLGVFFNWILFEYDNAESGQAWVYAELVRVIGDLSSVPTVDPFAEPTSSASESQGTTTQEAQLQTPGGLETATAESRVLAAPTEATITNSDGFPATFTPSPNIVERQPDSERDLGGEDVTDNIFQSTVSSFSQGRVPPILPIALLFVFGTLGFFVALLRR